MENQKFYIKRYNNGSIGLRASCIECGTKARDKWRKQNAEHDNRRNHEYNVRNAVRIRGEKLTQYWPGSDWQQALEKYEILRHEQNDLCAICKKYETRIIPRTGKRRDLAVDHCHLSNKVRGLLCNKCNRGIGLLGDTEEIILNAIIYLNKHKEPKDEAS